MVMLHSGELSDKDLAEYNLVMLRADSRVQTETETKCYGLNLETCLKNAVDLQKGGNATQVTYTLLYQ
jgi:hypothetical protein